ncbi:MAG TPA: YidC/Oxa1 family membrane protein insertase [Dehalococcoidia bacterium]|nr:YidC/Oxa1 family membrane protein insertase [Dehalococcoidia bacterium]
MPKTRNIVLLILLVLVFLFVGGFVSPIELFDIVILQPMLNFLILLTKVFFGSFGLAIIILTIIVRGVTIPLSLRQIRSTRAMQELQPKLKELQKKYAKDKEKLGPEIQKLYKEHGVNPFGCALPMLVQFPIWIGLYQSVIQGLGYAPENLIGLSKQLYSWSVIQEQVPLDSHFLGLDLGSGSLIMAILVAVSMWILQKMSSSPSADPSQQSMQRMLLWIMPLMFGFFALTFPSGLSLYWLLTNLISILVQYRVTGWGSLRIPSLATLRGGPPGPVRTPASTTGASESGGSDAGVVASQPEAAGADTTGGGKKPVVREASSRRKKVGHGKHRGKRKIRRRSR